ncbi:MAG: enoyl-CoA hydratase/isomerase family protein [Chloroflexi bacterium]|nr:enoyl-CoA hydratase/isomerase family protein [Chloroflexota bacterium]GIW09715.1 MAG: enoyl-CoA hydratase [Dehalococcoidia bacterium]
MADESVLIERKGPRTTVTLNRPAALNAIALGLHRELARVFRELAEDEETALVVLTGAGRAFSAGGDMTFLQELQANDRLIEEVVRHGRTIILSLLELPQPVLAAVNGDAIGLGCSLALACDCVIAVETARFGDPHVRLGLVPGDGGALFWPALVGPARAKEYLFTGRLLPAPEAAQLGLINRAVPADALWPTVDALAEEILANPPAAVRGAKRAVNRAVFGEAGVLLDLSLALEAQTLASTAFREAVAAWLERRRPEFRGR